MKKQSLHLEENKPWVCWIKMSKGKISSPNNPAPLAIDRTHDASLKLLRKENQNHIIFSII